MTTRPAAEVPGLGALFRGLGLLALGLGALVAFLLAAAAAMVVAIMVAGASLAMRLWPRREARGEPGLLEARRTPDGWVVEPASR